MGRFGRVFVKQLDGTVGWHTQYRRKSLCPEGFGLERESTAPVAAFVVLPGRVENEEALAGFGQGLSRRNGEYETWVDSVKTKQRNWSSVGSRSRGRVQCSCYLGVLIVQAVRDAQS